MTAGRTNAAPKPRLRGISHLYAIGGAAVAAIVLVAQAHDGEASAAAAVYGATLVVMFVASALYHRGSWNAAVKQRLLRLDHTAIFLLIAGTYTPTMLLAVDSRTGAQLLGVVWTMAVAGIAFEWIPVRAPRGYVTAAYLVLGWTGAFALASVWERTGATGSILLAAGGLCYTIGAIVHAARRPDPWPAVFGYHEVFHVLVIVAAALQYVAIAEYVLPLGG
jgi:hemolysin III